MKTQISVIFVKKNLKINVKDTKHVKLKKLEITVIMLGDTDVMCIGYAI